jgi:hypothetical protein
MLTDLEIVARLPFLENRLRLEDAEIRRYRGQKSFKVYDVLDALEEGVRRVSEENWPKVEDILGKLAKRAAKLKVAPPRVEGVRTETVPVVGSALTDDRGWGWGLLPEMARYRVVRTESRPIVLDGWTFVATIQHLGEDGNLLKTSPNFVGELPKSYRTDSATCDHCRLSRRRLETFVLQHTDGRFTRIGRNCLVDFLGLENADRCVDLAEMEQMLFGALDDAEGRSYGRGGAEYVTPGMYLGVVVLLLAKVGWLSRSLARERNRIATADLAWGLIFPRPGQAPVLDADGDRISVEDVTPEMAAEARAALDWARGLDAETSSDFLFNLRVMARQPSWTGRETGLGAAVAMSYQKEQARLKLQAFERATPSLPLGPEKLRVGAGKGKKAVPPVRARILGLYTRDGDYGPSTIVRMQADSATLGHVHDLVWFASGAQITAAVFTDGVLTGAREIVVGDVVDVTGTLGTPMTSEKTKRISTKLSRCALVGVTWASRSEEKSK